MSNIFSAQMMFLKYYFINSKTRNKKSIKKFDKKG